MTMAELCSRDARMRTVTGRTGCFCRRSLHCFLATIVCVFYGTLVGSLVRHHNRYHIAEEQQNKQALQRPSKSDFAAFEAATKGELLPTNHSAASGGNSNTGPGGSKLSPPPPPAVAASPPVSPLPPPTEAGSGASYPPTGECAINLFGLPRSFKHHVLPSLVTNVVSVNTKYRCDYFVHFFNATTEQSEPLIDETNRSGSQSNTTTYSRGGNVGGNLYPNDVYFLKEAVVEQHGGHNSSSNSSQRPITVDFVSDTNAEFSSERKPYIQEIVFGTGGDQASNPYFVKEASFTEQTLLNILKMWHSQDKVWNLMERTQTTAKNRGNKRYKRVAMLRLDVIYTTPIDVYKIPTDEVPDDYNEAYLQNLKKFRKDQKAVDYFYDYGTTTKQHCVLPGFKSFPVNDRYFAGSYEAVKIWASDRFSRARRHVTEILPALESKRLQSETPPTQPNGNHPDTDSFLEPVKYTDFGLHDEKFVAHTILPAIKDSVSDVSIHVDRDLWFARVRADGSIWLKDKPGFGRIKIPVLEHALGRKCTGEPYEVSDPILKEKTPGRWQIKCPPTEK